MIGRGLIVRQERELFQMLVDFVQVEGNVPFCRVADVVAVKAGDAQGLEVGAEDIGRHL